MNNFLEAILIGNFGLGSDGSVKGLSTTYSSRIQSRSSLHTFITSHSKSEPTSTLRAEAYGYLGCLYLLHAAAATYLLSQGHTIDIPSTDQYILSLAAVRKICRVTMDTLEEAAIVVHQHNGNKMKYLKSSHGLYYYDAKAKAMSANYSIY